MRKATKPTHKQALVRKTDIINQLAKDFSGSSIAILTDYRGKGAGLSVKDFRDLRKKLREQKGQFQVVKNTLALRALKKSGITGISDYFSQPTAITFGFEDPATIAKTLLDFAKDHRVPPNEEGLPLIKAAYMDGAILDVRKVKALALLPPKPVLIGQMLGSLQSPIRGLMNVLNGTLTELVNVLSEIRKSKETTA